MQRPVGEHDIQRISMYASKVDGEFEAQHIDEKAKS